MVSPPAVLTATRPRAPSDPVPESTTATPHSPQCSAIESNRRSMLGLGPKRGSGSLTTRRSRSTRMSWFGGPMLTVPGSRAAPSTACLTCRGVQRDISSTSRLRRSGERCCATTNAGLASGGRLPSRASRASSPPADAPMPTICSTLRLVSVLSSSGCPPCSESCAEASRPSAEFSGSRMSSPGAGTIMAGFCSWLANVIPQSFPATARRCRCTNLSDRILSLQ